MHVHRHVCAEYIHPRTCWMHSGCSGVNTILRVTRPPEGSWCHENTRILGLSSKVPDVYATPLRTGVASAHTCMRMCACMHRHVSMLTCQHVGWTDAYMCIHAQDLRAQSEDPGVPVTATTLGWTRYAQERVDKWVYRVSTDMSTCPCGGDMRACAHASVHPSDDMLDGWMSTPEHPLQQVWLCTRAILG